MKDNTGTEEELLVEKKRFYAMLKTLTVLNIILVLVIILMLALVVKTSKEYKYYDDTNYTCMQDEEVDETVNPIDENMLKVKKPVIYLYGYDKETVNVKLDFDGDLTCTYPEYDKNNGWSVTAYEDGRLVDKNKRQYDYLYWEGEYDTAFSFNTGFCVKGEDTASFLEDELDKLGLEPREINDFITYWLPKMQDNKYNVISFQTKAYTETAKLTVLPSPDVTIRVFMAWYPSDDEVELKAQSFKIPERDGKVLIEWGGCQVDSSDYTQLTDKKIAEKEEELEKANKEAEAAKEKADAEAKKQAEDAQKELVKQQEAAAKAAQAAQAQAASGHPFTDKNGSTTTFTTAEWNKLVSVWAYTGQAEEMISHHTIAELRTVLGSM